MQPGGLSRGPPYQVDEEEVLHPAARTGCAHQVDEEEVLP